MINIGLRPIESEIEPQMGEKISWQSANREINTPSSWPLAPNWSTRKASRGMITPKLRRITAREKYSRIRLRC